jgi:hypothetical protein
MNSERSENNEDNIKEVIVQENQLQDSLIPLSEPVVQAEPINQEQNQPQNQIKHHFAGVHIQCSHCVTLDIGKK